MKAAPAVVSASNNRSVTAYVLFGVFALVLALIVQAPASLLKKAIPAGLPVQLEAFGGTVWNGQVNWQQGADDGQLRWHLRPWRLLTGKLVADIEAEGGLQLTGQLKYGLGGWAVEDIDGRIPDSMVHHFLPAGWELPGDLQAKLVSVGRAGLEKGAWKQAGGSLHWGGGAMRYNVNGQQQAATLPPLLLNVRLDNDTLVLGLQTEAGGLGLATLRLSPDNMLETQLRQRLLAYTPGYRGDGAPDQVVVTAKQPL